MKKWIFCPKAVLNTLIRDKKWQLHLLFDLFLAKEEFFRSKENKSGNILLKLLVKTELFVFQHPKVLAPFSWK